MIAVYVLIALNLVVFLAGLYFKFTGQPDYTYAYGVQANELVFAGQYWRLITAMFLHADVYHIFGNMLSLFYLGSVVSRFYSKGEFLLIYFISGFVGNLLSLAFLPVNVHSLGASGAVMGLGGVLIYLLLFSKNRKTIRSTGNFLSLVIMVFFNLIYGVIQTGSNINNFAHFGGFFAGAILAWIIDRRAERKMTE